MERVDDLLRDLPPGGEVVLVVGGAELLRTLPCDEHFVVGGVGFDRGGEPGALLVGEVLRAGAEDGLDPVERVALATAVPEGVLLDAAASSSLSSIAVL